MYCLQTNKKKQKKKKKRFKKKLTCTQPKLYTLTMHYSLHIIKKKLITMRNILTAFIVLTQQIQCQ